jgi:hypothetical protein
MIGARCSWARNKESPPASACKVGESGVSTAVLDALGLVTSVVKGHHINFVLLCPATCSEITGSGICGSIDTTALDVMLDGVAGTARRLWQRDSDYRHLKGH